MHTIFGTDGIRAKIGSAPFTSTQLVLLSHALAKWITEKYTHPCILLAQDTRISCDWIKHTLISTFLSYGIDILDAQILPTPGVFHIMKKHPLVSCSIVISASHNPFSDNGIKLIDAKTGKITALEELRISQLYGEPIESRDLKFGTYAILKAAKHEYIQSVLASTNLTQTKNFSVVLDTTHGATYQIAPRIFKKLGIKVYTINNKPNGTNINDRCGAVHLDSLINEVLRRKADIGFAFDGDGDRVIAVNCSGTIKDGDDLLALLLEHPKYMHEKILVGTSMSNQGLAKYCTEKNIELIRTDVGDKYVSRALDERSALLGGEQSGHIILKDILPTGDGILVALKVLESITAHANWDMTTFNKFPQVLLNMRITKKQDLQIEPFKNLLKCAEEKLDSGRLLVRYSGTELILRIMAEAETLELATAVCNELAQDLSAFL